MKIKGSFRTSAQRRGFKVQWMQQFDVCSTSDVFFFCNLLYFLAMSSTFECKRWGQQQAGAQIKKSSSSSGVGRSKAVRCGSRNCRNLFWIYWFQFHTSPLLMPAVSLRSSSRLRSSSPASIQTPPTNSALFFSIAHFLFPNLFLQLYTAFLWSPPFFLRFVIKCYRLVNKIYIFQCPFA